MMRALVILAIAALLALIAAPFALQYISEPAKHSLWDLLQTFAPFLLIGSALLALFILLRTPRRNPSGATVLVLLLAATTVHYFGANFGLAYPANISDADTNLHIRVPFDQPAKVAWGGDDPRRNYHAAYPDQRWAYDLVIAPYGGPPKALDQYGCYGTPVLAPVDGIVGTAVDGQDDLQPGTEYSGDEVFGNYLVIRPVGTELRLVLAHLKSGSVKVGRDQRVSEGQVIAECGNSGASTEPHLHIHLLQLKPDGEDTVMLGQPLYFRDHSGSEMPSGSLESELTSTEWSGETIRHQPE